MEKVVYCLTSTGREAPEPGLGERLRTEVTDALLGAGAHGVQVNVVDAAVEAAEPLRILTSASPADALVSVWVDSANDRLRRPFDDAVADGPWSSAAYLVTESAPLADRSTDAAAGGRTPGFAQIAFFRRPENLPRHEWLTRWLDDHTRVAIDTQSTFVYVQNVVARVLTPGATAWDAIVEECFPAAAMTDPNVFFDAEGDDERLAAHQTAMFDSVQRFIDLSSIEVIATSRYVMAALPTGTRAPGHG
jgi:hypothetical protein